MTQASASFSYRGRRIVTVLQDMRGGGAERIAALLANGMAGEGAELTLLLLQKKGPVLDALSDKVRIVDLGIARTFKAVPVLARQFRALKPDAIIAHMTHINVAVLIAAILAGCRHKVILVEHNQFDLNLKVVRGASVKLAYQAARVLYLLAGKVVGVAGGVADTLARCTLLSRKSIAVAYNPVVTEDIFTKAAIPASHPFLGGNAPVVLGIGKLSPQKDFTTFLEAIALASRKQKLRAVILGEGVERPMLEAKRAALGLDEIVDLPGFATNPYSFIAATDMFVLSSRWEGLPTVVIEALALGANIVSTDCPSGPREILGDDQFGRLVPVGDAAALADAILAALAAPKDAAAARARGQDFTLATALTAYGRIIADLPA